MENEQTQFQKRVNEYRKEKDFLVATLMTKYKLTETVCLTKKHLKWFDKILVKIVQFRKIMVASIYYDKI